MDTKVFDVSKFSVMHPGGLSVLLDEEVGKKRYSFNALSSYHENKLARMPQPFSLAFIDMKSSRNHT